MDMRRISHGTVSICLDFLIAGCFCLFITACGITQTLPPSSVPVVISTSTQVPPTSIAPVTILPPLSTPTLACINNLAFIDDLTIPDNSVVTTGQLLDKQWLVQNSGDCNWDASYRLRCVSGDPLGASPEQSLYPARAGTQATLRILFTSPQKPGVYISEWQAFDANGIPFGASFFIKIKVQ